MILHKFVFKYLSIFIYIHVTKPLFVFKFSLILLPPPPPSLWPHSSPGNHDQTLRCTICAFTQVPVLFWLNASPEFFLSSPCKKFNISDHRGPTLPPGTYKYWINLNLHYFRKPTHKFGVFWPNCFREDSKDFLYMSQCKIHPPIVAHPTQGTMVWTNLNLNLHYMRMLSHNLSSSGLMDFWEEIM